MQSGPPSERSRIRRIPENARYDTDAVRGILDEGFVCHVGVIDDGQPFVLPMAYGRIEDTLYLHGSVASRLMRRLCGGSPVCVTVTLLDGIVVARSAFHTSMNYRSVTVLGTSRAVDGQLERMSALRSVLDQCVPGHWDRVREPNEAELRQTLVAAVDLQEAAAKVRTGPPSDEDADLASDRWAGVLPLLTSAGHPVADPRLRSGVGIPDTVHEFVNHRV